VQAFEPETACEQSAYDKWLDQTSAREEARQDRAHGAKARTNIQRATNYVLAVVLFAAVLFFAGMSTRLESARMRRILLGFGVILFLGTVAWIATFPVNISI
jgi:hypothetical protein